MIQRYWPITASGLSHSEIHGSEPACGFPWLIATCYVLLRLLAPRHPPFALSSLITKLPPVPSPCGLGFRKKLSELYFFALVSIFSSFPMCSCQRTAPSCHPLMVFNPEKPLARQIKLPFSGLSLYSTLHTLPSAFGSGGRDWI